MLTIVHADRHAGRVQAIHATPVPQRMAGDPWVKTRDGHGGTVRSVRTDRESFPAPVGPAPVGTKHRGAAKGNDPVRVTRVGFFIWFIWASAVNLTSRRPNTQEPFWMRDGYTIS